jgi:integrase/recombinase XerC
MARSKPDDGRFEPALARFLDYLKTRERSPNTVRAYSADLEAFAGWYASALSCPLANVLEISAVELREWKRDMLARGLRPASVNRRLSAVQSFERWAAETSLIPGAPERPTSCRQERPGARWLDRKERLALMRAVERAGSPRDRAIAVVLLNTGLRVAELAALEWPDVTITDRKGVVTVKRGKGAKWREVPLNDDARKAFQSIGYPGDGGRVWIGKRGPLTVQGIQKVVETFGAAAGIDLSCHLLRHTFCHDLLAAGIGLEKVASLAGHDSIETTRRYVEPSQSDLQDAVDALGDNERDEPRSKAPPRRQSSQTRSSRGRDRSA